MFERSKRALERVLEVWSFLIFEEEEEERSDIAILFSMTRTNDSILGMEKKKSCCALILLD